MPLTPDLRRLIEQARATAQADIGVAFNHLARRVAEREAASGVRSSGTQARVALQCLEETRTRLANYSQGVSRILTAARCQPSGADQTELLQNFTALMEELLTLVARRADSLGEQSVMMRNTIARQFGGALAEARRLARHEFEVMLLESAHAAPPAAANPTTYIFMGPNARVNNQSVDVSTNVVALSEPELFSNLQRTLDSVTDPALRDRLGTHLATLRGVSDATAKRVAYAEFVAAGIHTPSLQPFVAPLAHWVTQ